MYPITTYELALARIADLRRQARRDAQARVAADMPSHAPRPGRRRLAFSLRRAGRQRRLRRQLWTLLHAQALLDGPATVPHQDRLHARAASPSGRR